MNNNLSLSIFSIALLFQMASRIVLAQETDIKQATPPETLIRSTLEPNSEAKSSESLLNEIGIAINRGINWLAMQQSEDGSFNGTNKLFYTINALHLLMEKEEIMDENINRIFKWIVKQQAEDGGFGETNRHVYAMMLNNHALQQGLGEARTRLRNWSLTNFLPRDYEDTEDKLEMLDPTLGIDRLQRNWREKQATHYLAKQIVNDDFVYWQVKDVEVHIRKEIFEIWELWEFFWGILEFSPTPKNDENIVKMGRFHSDLEATIFSLAQLMHLKNELIKLERLRVAPPPSSTNVLRPPSKRD